MDALGRTVFEMRTGIKTGVGADVFRGCDRTCLGAQHEGELHLMVSKILGLCVYQPRNVGQLPREWDRRGFDQYLNHLNLKSRRGRL